MPNLWLIIAQSYLLPVYVHIFAAWQQTAKGVVILIVAYMINRKETATFKHLV